MSAQDLLFSDEFEAYRQKELECAVDFMYDIFKGTVEPAYIRGAMKMLSKILKVPEQFAGTKEAKQRAADLINRDFKKFEAKFVKAMVEE